jgi:hypothetical protein
MLVLRCIKVARRNALPQWTITIGASVFVIVLFLAAYWDPTIRWLHFFQAWMYVAAIALSWRGNKWGYFIGISAALFWNYITLFVNTFLKSGLQQFSILLHRGHIPKPDQFIAVPGWLGNALLILGCLLAYSRVSRKQGSDVLRFLVSFAGATAFFALAMAVSQPRYLPLFRMALHPHLHL